MNLYIRLCIILICSIFFISSIQSQSSAPRVSIQGTLKDNNGAVVEDGEYAVTFKLYNSATGGTALWSEEATISVAGGIYNHYLGSVNPLNGSNFSSILYVGVKVGAYELAPRTELTYAPYAFAVREVACSGAVGDIKYSILNPTQFAQVNGACWVPMDGRVIAGSKLNTIIGASNVPNGGGLFIRAQEHAGGMDNDPDRTTASAIATFQDQTFLQHNHPVNDPGHSHSYLDAKHKLGQVNSASAAGQGTYDVAHFLTNEIGWQTNNTNPSLTIANSSGNETRPKNLNFWIYIRIN
jgi:hypothetical protein